MLRFLAYQIYAIVAPLRASTAIILSHSATRNAVPSADIQLVQMKVSLILIYIFLGHLDILAVMQHTLGHIEGGCLAFDVRRRMPDIQRHLQLDRVGQMMYRADALHSAFRICKGVSRRHDRSGNRDN